jgi:aspartate/methionine/tyrosine aminotransferase
MSVERLRGIAGFSIDKVAEAAGRDPEVLRLENYDTDVRPPGAAIEATRRALDADEYNSYLPFAGRDDLRDAVAVHIQKLSGRGFDPRQEITICAGGTEGMLDVLLATVEAGDEVIVTDPTYAGMINRVRLAGGVPRFVPFVESAGAWKLDLDALRRAASNRTRLVFVMNPSTPNGAVFGDEEWEAIAEVCERNNLWLLYNAAFERILYDGRGYRHPASYDGLARRTITVGSVSKEYRMIGWRIGWIVAPRELMTEIAKVRIYNVVTPPGVTQAGAQAALTTTDDGLAASIAEWQARRDVALEELDEFGMIAAAGGWSMVLDVSRFGVDGPTASERLLSRGKIAVTPMKNWGERRSEAFVRVVFSNEPAARLRGLRERVLRSF